LTFDVAFTAIIHGLFRAGRLEDACNLYNEMCQNGVVPNCYTYNVLLHGFCKARDMESAKKILEKMLSAGFWPDTVSLNTLVNFLCKSGHVYLAADLFTKMKVVGFEPDEITYGMLVDGLCLAGRPDDAYRLLENELEYYDFPVPINSTPNEMNRAVISIAQDGENKK
jgi:pentatricopeptide repeat protein